jgi:hypothetical protein
LKNGFRITGVYGRVISGIVPVSAGKNGKPVIDSNMPKPAYKPVRPLNLPMRRIMV